VLQFEKQFSFFYFYQHSVQWKFALAFQFPAMAKEGELAVQKNNPKVTMDNEKAGLTDKDAVDLAGVGKRQQLGVSTPHCWH
jgi:hypothetical protein